MSKPKSRSTETLEQKIKQTFQPGRHIGVRESDFFVEELAAVAEKVQRVAKPDPARAAKLFELFLECLQAKAGEIEDNDDQMTALSGAICALWIQARQAADADRAETARTLLDWMEADRLGFTLDMETRAPEILDEPGLLAWEQEVQSQLKALDAPEPDPDQDWKRAHLVDSLLGIYAARGDLERYLALAETAEPDPGRCAATARLLEGHERFEEALTWVERGIRIEAEAGWDEPPEDDLHAMRRDLLTRLGRNTEALQDAWDRFESNPSPLEFQQLLRYIPKTKRWRGASGP